MEGLLVQALYMCSIRSSPIHSLTINSCTLMRFSNARFSWKCNTRLCLALSALKEGGDCQSYSQETQLRYSADNNTIPNESVAQYKELAMAAEQEGNEENTSWAETEKKSGLPKLARDMFSVNTSSHFDIDYLGESTKGDLNVRSDFIQTMGDDGALMLEGTIEEVAKAEVKEAEMLLNQLQILTVPATEMDETELVENMQKLLIVMQRLDQKIAPMLEADGAYFNTRWGYLSRAGLWDKSHLARQIEKYADIYTSRVSNFLQYTPFIYFRSQAQTLAHDLHLHWE